MEEIVNYQLSIVNYTNKHGFEQLSPKAVLFDMDGVLYNSMPNHAVAWQQSMALFGITMSAHDAYATEGARGVDTIRMMVKQQQGRDIDEAEAQRMYDEKTRLFHQLPEAKVMDGIPELMAQIHADGLTIGVVTGSGQRPLINRLLTDFKGYLTEDRIVTAYDVKRGKPNPDPYLMGLQKCGGLNPWEAIVVENAPLGVKAGVAACIFTIAVNTGPLPDVELKDAGANLVFPSMPQLSDEWNSLKIR
ncbi:MAG: HAD-IA family hydrolase [Bacteroidaceae bacterium]|nr:HAD-IA family hydrolase [Bacteroidaceae bacterium]